MARMVKIAACNVMTEPVGSFGGFAAHVRRLLDQARDADLVLFPELFTIELLTTYPDWERAPLTELPRVAAFTDDFKRLFETEAKQRGQHIAAGSTLVECDGGYENTTFLYGPTGLVHTHAKTHIFPPEADWNTVEGNVLAVAELPFARVGITNCYEAEIPECAASLAEQGAEILLAPSFTFTEHGFWRVRHCAQARCIENQVYAVHCCTGARPRGLLPAGWAQSSILAPCDQPWPAGGVLAEARANWETVVQAVVDLDALHRNRELGAAPTFRDRRRRRDLYQSSPSHLHSGSSAPELQAIR
ncbi:MAG: nitrilase-related carbon-nitrogen hydrolase [Gaiellales bacterium]